MVQCAGADLNSVHFPHVLCKRTNANRCLDWFRHLRHWITKQQKRAWHRLGCDFIHQLRLRWCLLLPASLHGWPHTIANNNTKGLRLHTKHEFVAQEDDVRTRSHFKQELDRSNHTITWAMLTSPGYLICAMKWYSNNNRRPLLMDGDGRSNCNEL